MMPNLLTSWACEIPFRENFRHASKDRSFSENFVVRISNNDIVGLGESCPRQYVTGETLQTCSQFFEIRKTEFSKINTLSELKNTQGAAIQPAAWCAIELAFLDLMARKKNISVEQLIGLSGQRIKHQMTAVIGASDWVRSFKRILRFRLYGFKDFKVKVSGNLTADLRLVRTLAATGIGAKNIRLDANNLFVDRHEAIEYFRHFKNAIWAIEEPLPARSFENLKDFASELSVKIILDESCTTQDDLAVALSNTKYFIPNIRISKMGGLLRSIDFAKQVIKAEGKFILGSHVGESSLLARAALVIANNFSDHCLAFESGYGPHLLSEDPFSPSIGLKYGGNISQAFSALGLGLSLNSQMAGKFK
jgi:L-Ala-D/L-Glu epimerase